MVEGVNELSCVSLFSTRLEKELFHCEEDVRQVTGGNTRNLVIPQDFKRLFFCPSDKLSLWALHSV